jgi:uncharacterized ferritin-like protein (DUF455 family)
MDVFEFASEIIFKGDLKSKLTDGKQINWESIPQRVPVTLEFPERDDSISFSEEQIKFPKKGALQKEKQRGKALHFFANHELLAIEMMAASILLFPNQKLSVLKSLVDTISEEQYHFKLYLERMKDFGVEFGDYPLNQFFWSFMTSISNVEEFYSVVALTFEQANLDFALYYKTLFYDIGDPKTAEIMDIIYRDEIKHVARGKAYLSKVRSLDTNNSFESFWDYFLSLLPSNLSPERAKGIIFDEDGRKKAGLSEDFIKTLKSYKSDFKITQRKEWK